VHELVKGLQELGLLVDELAVAVARGPEALGRLDAVSNLALGL